METSIENKKPKSEINLRKLMQKLGLGTNAFAEACGVSTQSMSQYLRPDKSLTTSTIYKIATALDIDPRDMFFPTEEDSASSSPSVDSNIPSHQDDTSRHSPAEADDHSIKLPPAQDIMPVTTFCPHCGKRVRVGVVLLPEED